MAVTEKSECNARDLLKQATDFLWSANCIDDYYAAIKMHFLALHACPEDSLYITSMKSGIGECYAKFGHFLYQNKTFDLAKNYYSKALDYNPEHHYARYQIGLILIKQEKYADAIESFEAVIELSNQCDYAVSLKDKADTWHNIACAANLSHKEEKAKYANLEEQKIRNLITVHTLNSSHLTLFTKLSVVETHDFSSKNTTESTYA